MSDKIIDILVKENGVSKQEPEVQIKRGAISLGRITLDPENDLILNDGPGFVVSGEHLEIELEDKEFDELDQILREDKES